MKRVLIAVSLACAFALAVPSQPASAQQAATGQLRTPDVIYVPTPPEVVAASKQSYTGRYLATVLARQRPQQRMAVGR